MPWRNDADPSEPAENTYRRGDLEWMQHLPNAATNHEFRCRFCKFATKDPRLFLRHLDIQACLRPFQCQHCPKAFYNKYGRTRHEKTHANKTSGRRPSTLEPEGPARGDDKPYTCQLCSKALGSKTGWRSHLRMHTGYGLHECPTCSKAFVDRTALGIHMRRHTGDKPFGCAHCSKRFASKGEVRIHTKAHERHAVQVPTLPGGKRFEQRPKAPQ